MLDDDKDQPTETADEPLTDYVTKGDDRETEKR